MAMNSSDNNILQLNEVIVAMVPWPEHGHLNPLFLLSRFIASHNIPVHFLSLTARNQDLKKRLQGAQRNASDDNLHFSNLSASESDKDVLLEKLGESICEKCHELSKNTKRLVIIHDCLMITYIGDLCSIPNLKCYFFHSISSFVRYSTLRQVIDIVDEGQDKLIQQLGDEFPTVESTFGPNLEEYIKEEREWKLSSGVIMNSFRELEGKYLDSLSIYVDNNKPLWCLGPFHMLLESSIDIRDTSAQHVCLEFLDKQDVKSVLFVSFGTTTTLSQEQVNELALGLEQSNHKFIWVIREADDERMDMENNSEGKDVKIELPKGFEERVKGRGMVVRNWAPQLEILGHPSTGGFMSHCGWNSCMESISMGVPIASWPIHVDQPYNTVFVTNVLKIGISVWNWTRREEVVPAAAIEKAVKTLMGTPEGDKMRQRAVELSNKIKNSVSHGGLARKEVEYFISSITNN
ncbi:zeatin O-glucosyltransferase-like [Lycium ferocissimum]|uniref:zeatin O-glucosyltransferase-like n=1 Tax=Lycium ferocissimum TaxID=112874 RepID=UPI002814DDD6|nr:zeatin O-glucosyltransferase-like [Lycium ferocissimum]